MPVVTVPGGNTGAPTASYTFSSGPGLTIAQQIGLALAQALQSSNLNVTTATGSPGAVSSPPVQELYVPPAFTGSQTAGAGYYAVVDASTSAVSISAATGTAILGGTVGGTYSISSNSTVDGSGTGNVYNVSGNADVVAASGADSVIFGSGATAGNDTIYAGAGASVSVYSSTGVLEFVQPSSGATTWVGGATTSNPSTTTGGNGTSVSAGASGVVFVVNAPTSSGSQTVTVATSSSGGLATVYGAANTEINLTGGSGTGRGMENYMVAGTGNETLNAGGASGAVWMSVNSNNPMPGGVSMIAGSGNDTLIAGSAPGSVTMTGGSGNDLFVFFKQASGGAVNVINNFNATNDAVYILNYGGGGSAAQLQANSTVANGNLTLTLNDGTSITFTNLTDKSTLNGRIGYF